MTWQDFPWGAVLTFAGLISAVLLLAMDERNRRKFATREDVAGMAKRMDERFESKGRAIERNTGLFVAIDDRVGDLEKKTDLLEERQSQQWGRIAEQMAATAKTIEDVARRLEDTSRSHREFVLEMEKRINKGESK